MTIDKIDLIYNQILELTTVGKFGNFIVLQGNKNIGTQFKICDSKEDLEFYEELLNNILK